MSLTTIGWVSNQNCKQQQNKRQIKMMKFFWISLCFPMFFTIGCPIDHHDQSLQIRSLSTRSKLSNIERTKILLPERSQYTDANIYEILAVSLLATMGSFLIPQFSTFLTYIVASNRFINRNPNRKKALPAIKLMN